MCYLDVLGVIGSIPMSSYEHNAEMKGFQNCLVGPV